ncbi:cupin domain-containing protein [Pleomorphovibrio marinus]|uniref:cupin domain-containing protein n=1 Tax=Pleomorphovibrio marinus TaxID=2164132 RepID=UPI000E0AB76D|nr:cupin domain-containing protein [Pleomorphovibrio marinus]
MKNLYLIPLLFFALQVTAQNISERIISNDPSKYRELTGVHAGAGKMGFTELIGRNDLATNFLYLHAGRIDAKSGIGHHFHHTIEEMFVILEGEAEFTVNGRTSTIKAPAVVPCKMGDSHAIYNPSNESISWLNFAVSKVKARTDAFDLGDTRVGASLDPIPTFVSGRLEKEKLGLDNPSFEGSEVLFRRILGPAVFSSDWNHVDHVVIPSGSNEVIRKLEGVEEVYYVTKGAGEVSINNNAGSIRADDALFGSLGETLTFSNTGTEDLELLVIGIASSKQKQLSALGSTEGYPKSMVLQMDFVVSREDAEEFEKMYHSIYVPAMTVQQGYIESKLLRMYNDQLSEEIEAEATNYNYQILISFDTEENRRKWVDSKQHDIAWPAATSLASEFKWRGYDVMGDNVNEK